MFCNRREREAPPVAPVRLSLSASPHVEAARAQEGDPVCTSSHGEALTVIALERGSAAEVKATDAGR